MLMVDGRSPTALVAVERIKLGLAVALNVSGLAFMRHERSITASAVPRVRRRRLRFRAGRDRPPASPPP